MRDWANRCAGLLFFSYERMMSASAPDKAHEPALLNHLTKRVAIVIQLITAQIQVRQRRSAKMSQRFDDGLRTVGG